LSKEEMSGPPSKDGWSMLQINDADGDNNDDNNDGCGCDGSGNVWLYDAMI